MNTRGTRRSATVLAAGLLAILPHPLRAQTAMPTPWQRVNNSDLPAGFRPTLPGRRAELPLSFEPNRGQADRKVKFLSRGAGCSLFLTPTEVEIVLQSSEGRRATSPAHVSNPSVLRMRLEGAHAGAMRGEAMLPGKTNYLIDRDPKRWHTDIPTYSRVRCSDVYPGVDLVYYGSRGQIEYDLIVAPRADPSRIALTFEGADRLSVDRAGDLVVKLKQRSVRWHRPVSYQDFRGKRTLVHSRFVLKGRNRVSFAVARYDTHRPLVIDPVFAYSTYFGGGGRIFTIGMGIDDSGNAYVAGVSESAIPGAQTERPGGRPAFVFKMDVTGSKLLYSTYIGADLMAWGMAVNRAGEVVVVGGTSSTALPIVNGFQSSISGMADGFLVKVNAAGNGLLYSTYLGGSLNDSLLAVALGPDGTAYVTGSTNSADFPTAAPFQASINGTMDAVIARIDMTKSGTASLVYATYLGGSGWDGGTGGIAVDSSGRFYIAGFTTSSDFPTVSAFQSVPQAWNAFVCAFSPAGDSIFYSTYLSGSGFENALGIVVDDSRHVFVCGSTSSPDFPIRNPVQAVNGGGNDAFVVEIDCGAAGDASLVYSTFLGGPNEDRALALTLDVWGNLCVTGSTVVGSHSNIVNKVFAAKIGRGGGALLFGAAWGGSNHDFGAAIAIDPYGFAYIAGGTFSEDFPVTSGAFQPHKAATSDRSDIFVLRMPTFTRLDFNGDATPDLLFQNRNDGRLAYWLMRGIQLTRAELLDAPSPSPNLRVVGSADLNGDGETDLIFQDSDTGDLSYWLMSRTHRISSGAFSIRNPGPNWQVVGVADMDRDGYADLVFQNSVSGDLYVWFTRGTTIIGGNYLSPRNPGASWRVAAVADLNNDGQPDLIFQNAETGNVYVWYMRYGTLDYGGFTNPADPGPRWIVAGTMDINGDGKPEILLQNAFTGQLVYWVMKGLNVQSFGFPDPANPGAPWQLAGAR